jgi:Xaa-Pro aminopeptidase
VNYRKRQRQLQNVLGDAGLDALLVTHLPNIQYLCGFTGSAAALFISEKQIVLFTDGRYTAQARAEVVGARIVIGKKAVLAAFADWLGSQKSISRNIGKLAFESDHMVFASHAGLANSLPRGIKLRSKPSLVEQARIVKDADEIERIAEAALLGSSLFDVALKVFRPGVMETKVAAEMEYAAAKAGAEGMSFHTIIASGKRSALPHGRASTQPIQPNGFVVCDFGVILTSYCSDMTRTVYVGRPTEEARNAYNAVREAQQAALDAIRPGRVIGEVDQAARKVLQKHKLARYFTHSTGHGVGLEIHEAPRIAAGQPEVLRPGMVITIEPGVYLPGRWGVRIEDMALVTEQGYKVLTPISKDLITV